MSKYKKFTYREKVNYYARLSYIQATKLDAGIPLEKVGYARSWLMGADYAEALDQKGQSVAKDPRYLKYAKTKDNLSVETKAFLAGCNSFLYDNHEND